ncbi:hypothetical protein Tco_1393145 [Tanacetum coccineum]
MSHLEECARDVERSCTSERAVGGNALRQHAPCDKLADVDRSGGDRGWVLGWCAAWRYSSETMCLWSFPLERKGVRLGVSPDTGSLVATECASVLRNCRVHDVAMLSR